MYEAVQSKMFLNMSKCLLSLLGKLFKAKARQIHSYSTIQTQGQCIMLYKDIKDSKMTLNTFKDTTVNRGEVVK